MTLGKLSDFINKIESILVLQKLNKIGNCK